MAEDHLDTPFLGNASLEEVEGKERGGDDGDEHAGKQRRFLAPLRETGGAHYPRRRRHRIEVHPQLGSTH